MSLLQSETEDVNSSSYHPQDQDSYTMIILDFDDTLVPTTIRKCMKSKFGIDVFKLKKNKSKLLKQLQITIVESLHNLRSKCNNITQIALVSHGSENWLKQMFSMPTNNNEDEKDDIFAQLVGDKNYKKEKIKLNILSKYFIENDVSIHSTTRELKNSKKGSKKWTIKYNTIKTLIANTNEELGVECSQIMSVGDGKHEKEALSKYCSRFGIRVIHFALVKAPTFSQLEQQWVLIKKADVDSFKKKFYFCVINMDEKIPNDNVDDCIGETHQLKSISKYFQYWLKSLNIQLGKKADYSSSKKLNSLAQKIDVKKKKMIAKGTYSESAFKVIVDMLCMVHPPLKKTIKGLGFESVNRQSEWY